MGAWGTGIFSDDLACDIRAEFRELIGEGVDTAEVTRKIIAKYKETIDDPDEGPLFWLALAATQSRCGRLIADVRKRAIRVIDAGKNLETWKENGDPKDLKKRQQVLLKLRAELVGAQRQPTKIRKEFHDRTEWNVGYAISYRLLSGKLVIMRVIGLEDNKSLIPIVELCDWIGDTVPDRKAIERLPRRQTRRYFELQKAGKLHRQDRETDHKFTVYSNARRHYPASRLSVVAMGLRVKRTDNIGACYFGGWRRLDEYLKTTYGIE
jgi:hypothetical protein